MNRALAIAAALLLAGCAQDTAQREYKVYPAGQQQRYVPPSQQQRMDPNTAAMIWMMYSNQMADDVMRARQAPTAPRYCYSSGGRAWCQ